MVLHNVCATLERSASKSDRNLCYHDPYDSDPRELCRNQMVCHMTSFAKVSVPNIFTPDNYHYSFNHAP
jgi:hypothetical protein